MESQFDNLRTNFEELSAREFSTQDRRDRYLQRLNSNKSIADALYDLRETPDFSITNAAVNFMDDEPPSTTDSCSQIYNTYMQAVDEEHPTYDPIAIKSNTINAIAYIYWDFEHIRTGGTPVSKLSIVQKIIHKLVNCSLSWSYTIKTPKEDFLQMAIDLRDDKPLFDIMNNFHADDLVCYGF